MTKTNQNNAPSPVTDEGTPAPETGTGNVVSLPNRDAPVDYLQAREAAKASALAMKAQSEQAARQKLAEAHDLELQGGDKAKEAKALTDEASFLLYVVRSEGAMTSDQLTALIADQYGYKPKKDKGELPIKGANHPDASKTPFGNGEALRKRIVRAVALKDFITANGETDAGGNFFEGLTPDNADSDGNTFADVLAAVDSKSLSLWTAYDKLTKIKGNAKTPASPAFIPKAINAIRETLAANIAESANVWLDNDELADAYASLRAILTIVGQEAGRIEMEREAA